MRSIWSLVGGSSSSDQYTPIAMPARGSVPVPHQNDQPSQIPKCTGCSAVNGSSTSSMVSMVGTLPWLDSGSSSMGMGTTGYAS